MVSVVSAPIRAVALTVRFAWVQCRSWLGGALVLSTVVALVPAAQVLVVGQLSTAIESGGAELWAPLVILMVLVLVGLLFRPIEGFLTEGAMRRLGTAYQWQLVEAVANIPPRDLATESVNARIQACRDSVPDLSFFASASVFSLQGLLTGGSLAFAVSQFSPLAGAALVLSLVPLVVVFAMGASLQNRLWEPTGEAQRRAAYLIEQLVTQRTGTELATLGASRQVGALAIGSLERAVALLMQSAVFVFRWNLLAAVCSAGMLAVALWQLAISPLGVGAVSAGLLGVISALGSIQQAGYGFGELIASSPKVHNFFRFTGSYSAMGRQEIPSSVNDIVVHDLAVSYPGRPTRAIESMTFSASRGQMVAFVGANGAGKTSLMNALLGVVATDQGTVSIDGIDATNMDSATRLAHFGMLTQEFGRYEFTVREAVQLGAPTPASDEAIWTALRSARLHRAVSAMPAGLSSMLGQQWGGIGLSGGEWQRLALARIYLRDAPIWVLDEPTSSIDSEAEAEIFHELAATKSGRITIVVSHRAWTLRDMDVIHVMDSGRVVESGTYGELLRRRGRFSELFALQHNNE